LLRGLAIFDPYAIYYWVFFSTLMLFVEHIQWVFNPLFENGLIPIIEFGIYELKNSSHEKSLPSLQKGGF
jgi:hypothetical protein